MQLSGMVCQPSLSCPRVFANWIIGETELVMTNKQGPSLTSLSETIACVLKTIWCPRVCAWEKPLSCCLWAQCFLSCLLSRGFSLFSTPLPFFHFFWGGGLFVWTCRVFHAVDKFSTLALCFVSFFCTFPLPFLSWLFSRTSKVVTLAAVECNWYPAFRAGVGWETSDNSWKRQGVATEWD